MGMLRPQHSRGDRQIGKSSKYSGLWSCGGRTIRKGLYLDAYSFAHGICTVFAPRSSVHSYRVSHLLISYKLLVKNVVFAILYTVAAR